MKDKPHRASRGWFKSLPRRLESVAKQGGVESVLRNSARIGAEEVSAHLSNLAANLARKDDEQRLSPLQRAALKRNARLRGLHRGERAFVFGNGPSLKNQLLHPLAGEITFVGNSFWRHPVLDDPCWNPTYYCFVDRRFFDGAEITDQFFANLRERCTHTKFIVRTRLMDVVRERKLIDEASAIEIATGGRMTDLGLDAIDLTQMLPAVESVLLVELMAAIYMGCSPIYLLGADHDWLATFGEDRHFHEGKTIAHATHTSVSPVHSSYRAMLEFCWRLWRNHELVRDIAIQENIEIYNATAGGALDVYPRMSLEAVLEGG